ncbi:MAG: beta-lactamase family protein [Deltaproteobacteria bacterium]|nr:beta-lactamase family protein [Deltaproteobacteria bacterium]MDQ3295744.1 beta-lactamase family protein [Myxococcota bacterium]
MSEIEREITALVDGALGRGVGSAAAVSVGDAGVEIARVLRGHTRRVPDRGEPIDARTWFDVASLTKPMATAACAMVLVGDGRLDLDTSIRRWIPDATSTGTVGQLLGHAAGCAAHVEFFRVLQHGVSDPRRELVAMAAREPASAPGVTAVYSDLGYIMLGAILERAAGAPLEDVFADHVAGPLGLAARYPGTVALTGAVATELDDTATARGLVCGRVHDENAYFGGGVCGHAGLFATLDDVARFAAAIVDTAAGTPRGRFRTDVVNHFATTAATPATSWRLGWDTPSTIAGVSHAGDRWPRTGSIGHLGFTGTSLWLDLPRRRWVALLTNRVHPTRHGGSADHVKALRRSVNDAGSGTATTSRA